MARQSRIVVAGHFEIKYVESVGGSAGSVKPDTTAGKAYPARTAELVRSGGQVISPNGFSANLGLISSNYDLLCAAGQEVA